MQTLSYTNRDYPSVFDGVKEIIKTLEPRAEVDTSKANVESIIAKIVAGCVDCLSYNQDANTLETFPSTSRDARAIFDLLSIVGYTPKTARGSKVYMSLWNPSYVGSVTYDPFNTIIIDGKSFYNPDEFTCSSGGVVTSVDWYQGKLTSPDKRNLTEEQTKNITNFIDKYYPNLSASTIKQDSFVLPETHTRIDSRTIRIYTPDGTALTYVEDPAMVYMTKSSFSITPTVNTTGYTLVFSKDISSGVVADNYYYFYLQSEGLDVGNNLTPDFTTLPNSPNFTFSYVQEASKEPETASEARENVVYEFGWRDTPKAIITRHDAERAILQQHGFVAAVDVRDGDNYSKASADNFNIQVFVKVTEDAEVTLDVGTAMSYQNRIQTHLNKFKMLPLNFDIHIDDVVTSEGELTTQMYYWYPDVTIYLKEQVDSQEASAILTQIYDALFKRYAYTNVNFNEVPRIVDVIDTIQNASDMILYLDIDGIVYLDKDNKQVAKEDITCSYTTPVTINETGVEYEVTLNTLNNTRNIQYHTIKIVDANNVVMGIDNGDGVILSQNGYLAEAGTIDYTTGKLNIKLALQPPGSQFYIYHKLETPTWCSFINNGPQAIKIALESIGA